MPGVYAFHTESGTEPAWVSLQTAAKDGETAVESYRLSTDSIMDTEP